MSQGDVKEFHDRISWKVVYDALIARSIPTEVALLGIRVHALPCMLLSLFNTDCVIHRTASVITGGHSSTKFAALLLEDTWLLIQRRRTERIVLDSGDKLSFQC